MRRRAGFTLIEVMVAVTILGTAMFVLLDAHYTAMRLHDTMQTAADFRQMLETTVNRAEVAVMQGELSGGGDFGARYPEFSWSYEATLVGTETIQLYEVTARVTGPEEEQMRTFLVYVTKTQEDSQGVGMFRRNKGGATGGKPATGAKPAAGANGASAPRASRQQGDLF